VVPRPGAPVPDDAELRAFCRARLAPYKVPTAFFVVESLPRTVSGKLRRSELRAALAVPAPAVPPRAGDPTTPDDAASLDVAPLHNVPPREDVPA
jgi:hypothetical protein